MIELLIFSISLLGSYAGVALFRVFSSKRELFDIPNDRSLHETPTPRGGGLVIVLISLLLYCFISIWITGRISWGYVIGAILVAAISWCDDLYSISFIIRFGVHATAAFLVIGDLGYWNSLYVPVAGVTLQIGTIGMALSFFWIVWIINAYNFMDGIDGIAGLQAVLAGAGWLIFAYIFGYESIYLFAGVLLFAGLGFLIHNWHPAKVFMGDVGSAFLGFTFAVLPMLALGEKPENDAIIPIIAVSLLWFFIFDTVLTFFIRLLCGERVWTAHRRHLYQRLVLSGKSHGFAASLYGLLAATLGAAAIGFAVFRGTFELLLLSSIIITTAILLLAVFGKNILTSQSK
ncbi:MAG: glycosyltransferase family 4 protein [Pyrinomonadaceae bacterium]